MAGRNGLGVFHAVQQMPPNIPIVVRPRLRAAAGRLQLGDDSAKQVKAVQNLQLRPGAVAGQYGHKLIADALGGNPFQQRRGAANAADGIRLHPKAQLPGQPRAAQHPARVCLERIISRRPQDAAGEVGPAAQRVNDCVKPFVGIPAAQRQAHSVHGEIAGAQVILKPAVVAGDVNNKRPALPTAAGQGYPRHIPRFQRNQRAAQIIRHGGAHRPSGAGCR